MVDWRRLDMRGVTPQPPAATPGGRGSWGKLDPADGAWLDPVRRPARQQTAFLVGLAVGAVLVGLTVVKVIVLAYRRFQR